MTRLKFLAIILVATAVSGFGGHWIAQYQAGTEFIRQVNEHIAAYGYVMQFTCEPPPRPLLTWGEAVELYSPADFLTDWGSLPGFMKGGTFWVQPPIVNDGNIIILQGGTSHP